MNLMPTENLYVRIMTKETGSCLCATRNGRVRMLGRPLQDSGQIVFVQLPGLQIGSS